MNEKTVEHDWMLGLDAGAENARRIVRAINAEPLSDDALEAFLLNLNAGLLGYGSARLGPERVRRLVRTMQAVLEQGIAAVAAGGASRGVH